MERSKKRNSFRGRRGINNPELIDRGQAEFKDRGCIVWPACLTCPLPRCVLETPGAGRARHLARTVRVFERLHAGESREQIILAEGISRRTYYRIVRTLITPAKAA